MGFPDEYKTMVGERGVTLSGGQKQRSSIARALLKDSAILILDDSLSAVDTDTEEQILENLMETRQGKTTIVIAHRISTLQKADHVAVLSDGKLTEYGTPEELLEFGGFTLISAISSSLRVSLAVKVLEKRCYADLTMNSYEITEKIIV